MLINKTKSKKTTNINFLKQQLPLFLIGGLFILIIIVANFSFSTLNKSKAQKIQLALDKLKDGNYKLYGRINIQAKENKLMENDINLVYNGIIINSDDTIKLDINLNSETLNIDKQIGSIYIKNNKIILDLNEQDNNYYYNVKNKNKNILINLQDLIYKLDDKIVWEGKEAINIRYNNLDKKMITNKFSIKLNNTDLVQMINGNMEHGDTQYSNKLIQLLNNNEFIILIFICIDNNNFLRGIEIIYQEKEYSIVCMSYFDKYNRVNKNISVKKITNNDMDIEKITNDELYKIFNIINLRNNLVLK
jgi:hypothetical protein